MHTRPLVAWLTALVLPLAQAQSPAPAPAVPAAYQGHGAQVGMDLRSGRPTIEARVNGQPLSITYDTGSQGPVIARSVATRLGLPVIGEAMLGSPAGGTPITAQVVALGSLEVGGVRALEGFRTLDAVVVDDDRLPAGGSLVVGNNQFPGMLVTLDFAARQFRLSAPAAAASAGWSALNERGLIETTLTVGQEQMPVHIDSGNPGALDLPAARLSALPVQGELREGRSLRLVNREFKSRIGALDTPATLAGVPVRLKGDFRFVDFRFANLGAQALQGSVLEVDAAHRRWRLSFQAEMPAIGASLTS